MQGQGTGPETPPPQDPWTRRQPATREGLLETAASIVTQPVPTIQRLVRERPVGWALAVIAVLSLGSALAAAASLSPADFRPPGEAPAATTQWRVTILVLAAIFGPVLGILANAIVSGIFHLASMVLGGKGTYTGLFVGQAFATIPSFFAIPFNLLPVFLGGTGTALSALVTLGIAIWELTLTVIAIRENNGFTTARATAALALSVVAVAALVFLIFILVLFLAIAAIGPG